MRETREKAVGYVRAFTNNPVVYNTQIDMIHDWCRSNAVECEEMFVDRCYNKDYCASDRERAEELRFCTKKCVYPQYEMMWRRIMESGDIHIILVDCKERLYDGLRQKQFVEQICDAWAIQIIEVGGFVPEEQKCETPIIYHCAIFPERRTRNVLNDIDALYVATSRLCSNSRGRLCLDWSNMSRKGYEQIKEDEEPKVIIVKRLEILNRKLCSVVGIAKHAKICSLEEGCLETCREGSFLREKKKVAVYDRQRSLHEKDTAELQQERFKVFVETQTDWEIVDTYTDTMQSGKVEWENLIKNIERYDVIMMESLVKFGESAGALFKALQSLNKSLFTLKEGVVLWEAIEK